MFKKHQNTEYQENPISGAASLCSKRSGKFCECSIKSIPTESELPPMAENTLKRFSLIKAMQDKLQLFGNDNGDFCLVSWMINWQNVINR